MENYEKVLLVRYAEIHLKGLNRPFFERKLEKNIDAALYGIPHKLNREQGRVFITDMCNDDIDTAVEKLTKVCGVHSVSVAVCVEKDIDTITEAAFSLITAELSTLASKTFKVFARRSDKNFPMTSDSICRELGGRILEKFSELSVDIHSPSLKVNVEIRTSAYIYTNDIAGVGGLPVGTSGRAMLLLSGGIDSPVAGYMITKRGVELSAIHFYSYPYTSERAKDKVVDLAKIVSEFSGPIRLYVVPFTEIQLAIHEHCPEKETTLLMRRLMMKISERIAINDSSSVLITGESLGQVASQTIESLCATDDAVSMPVFRPLIGMDKSEIMDIARRIGTYETSILPFEDCCTVFVPKHPTTKPTVEKIRESEAMFDFTEMVEKAINDTELIIAKHRGE